jgi:hypothetical protein
MSKRGRPGNCPGAFGICRRAIHELDSQGIEPFAGHEMMFLRLLSRGASVGNGPSVLKYSRPASVRRTITYRQRHGTEPTLLRVATPSPIWNSRSAHRQTRRISASYLACVICVRPLPENLELLSCASIVHTAARRDLNERRRFTIGQAAAKRSNLTIQCPLWVISGQNVISAQSPLYPPKEWTFCIVVVMSAFGQKRTHAVVKARALGSIMTVRRRTNAAFDIRARRRRRRPRSTSS